MGTDHFGVEDIIVSTVGNNKEAVYRYVENQLKEESN